MSPATDEDTVAVIDEAVESLVLIRAPFEFDVLPTISVLVSLAAEVDSPLPDAIADAREHGYCWEAISLGGSPPRPSPLDVAMPATPV